VPVKLPQRGLVAGLCVTLLGGVVALGVMLAHSPKGPAAGARCSTEGKVLPAPAKSAFGMLVISASDIWTGWQGREDLQPVAQHWDGIRWICRSNR
jgi:hypothetical protein